MNDILHSEKFNGHTINVYYDGDCESPLQHDDLVKVASWTRRYNFGNIDTSGTEPEEFYKDIIRERAEILPLYKYEHGQISLRTTPFHCRWDSGQIGFVYIAAKDGRENWGHKWREKARKCMAATVEEYSQYVNGETYWYELVDADGNEVGTCGGYIGLENCVNAAKQDIQ